MEHSTFGRLPPELRNNIYEFVLVQPAPLDLQPKLDPSAPKQTSVVASFAAEPLALVKTCKQIEAESSKLVYSGNTFSLTNWASSDDYTRLLVPCISQIGKLNAAAIRTIQVKIGSVAGNRDESRMTTAVANIQHRQRSLPACTFTLHFYVYGDRTQPVLELFLCFADGNALKRSRLCCTEKIENLARRMSASGTPHQRRRAFSMVEGYEGMLGMVCAKVSGLE